MQRSKILVPLRFTSIPLGVLAAEDLSGHAKLVYAGQMFFAANSRGWVWPSLGTLARMTRISPRSVRYCLRDLEAAPDGCPHGLITPVMRHPQYGSMVYQLEDAEEVYPSRWPIQSTKELFEWADASRLAGATPPPAMVAAPPGNGCRPPPAMVAAKVRDKKRQEGEAPLPLVGWQWFSALYPPAHRTDADLAAAGRLWRADGLESASSRILHWLLADLVVLRRSDVAHGQAEPWPTPLRWLKSGPWRKSSKPLLPADMAAYHDQFAIATLFCLSVPQPDQDRFLQGASKSSRYAAENRLVQVIAASRAWYDQTRRTS